MSRLIRPLSAFCEEEEGGFGPSHGGGIVSLRTTAPEVSPAGTSTLSAELVRLLAEERAKILDNDNYSAKEKLALLEDNRKAIVVANGGTVRRTENVVYGLLAFGSVGLIVLALLTTFAGLPHEVTLSFVGTVLGGTIATIAQKLGNL